MKRTVLLIVVFLLIGATINIVVAWSLAIRQPVRMGFGVARERLAEYHYAKVQPEKWIRIIERFGEIDAAQGGYAPTVRSWGPVRSLPYETLLPEWSRIGSLPDTAYQDDPFCCTYREVATGWPSLSLRFSTLSSYESTDVVQSSGRLQISSAIISDEIWGEKRRELPVHPIAWGFALNTILYAGLAWVLLGSPFWLRRYVRCKRGLCSQCGYDLRGDEHERCPECGTAVKGAASTAEQGNLTDSGLPHQVR